MTELGLNTIIGANAQSYFLFYYLEDLYHVTLKSSILKCCFREITIQFPLSYMVTILNLHIPDVVYEPKIYTVL